MYNICGPGCKHDFNRVQQLHSFSPMVMLDKISLGKKDSRKADDFAEINGAVLFGNNSNLHDGKVEHLSLLEVHNDSGLGSSLQVSPHESSSNVNPGLLTGVPNISTADVPALVQDFGRKGMFTGLRGNLSKMVPSRLKRRDASKSGESRE